MNRYIDADVQEVSRIVIEIPKEFIGDFMADRFADALNRLKADAHCLAGNYEKETAEMLITAMQNADVREVKHGHWMPHPTEPDCAVCSVCGTGCIREVGNIIYGYAYCPNCGADMQGNDEWFVRKFQELMELPTADMRGGE